MLLKQLAYILAIFMALTTSVVADEVTTITETNYYTPSYFKEVIDDFITDGNTLPTGIPVNFVYIEECTTSSTPSTSTIVATSSFYYTVSTIANITNTYIECEIESCTEKYSYSDVPTTYSTIAYVTYTTSFCPESETSSFSDEVVTDIDTATLISDEHATTTAAPSTIVTSIDSTYTVSTYTTVTNTVTTCNNNICSSFETITSSPTVYATSEIVVYSTVQATSVRQHATTVTASADPITVSEIYLVTTTTTIYQASTTPSSVYNGLTPVPSVTCTQSNPLVTQSPIYSSRTSTIKTSFSEDVTITSSTPSSLVRDSSLLSSDTKSYNAITSGTKNVLHTSGTKNVLHTSGTKNVLHTSIETQTCWSDNSIRSTDSRLFSGYFNSSSSYISSYSTSSEGDVTGYSSTVTFDSSSLESLLSGSSSSPIAISTSSSSSSSSSLKFGSSISISSTISSSLSAGSTSEAYSGDLFAAISTDEPLDVFSRGELPLELPNGVKSDDNPIETNKFWDNLILGDQTNMVWTYPYGMHWANSGSSYGFALQHTNIADRVYGSSNTNNVGVDSYYFNPIDVGELLISSTSFTNGNYMSISNMKSMSVLVQLSASSDDTTNYIEIPLVQGMGFVTSIYYGDLIPEIGSLVGIKSFTQEVISDSSSNKRSNILTNILKYRATLYSGSEWLIYVTLPSSSDSFELTVSDSKIVGSTAINGLIIQAVVAPDNTSSEEYYDKSAGMYVTGADVKGSVNGEYAEYSFVYSTEGSSEYGSPIIFALPHHVQSLTSDYSAAALDIQLPSTTKGNMTAFLTNKLVMSETLETSISFLPWSQSMTGSLTYTSEQLNLIVKAANSELNVDIAETVASLDSTYSSGKVIDKYAYILLVLSEIIQDEAATKSTLSDMKDAFAPFLANTQYYPFMYDQKFKGVTSTANNNGDTGADYGSGYYNDHHFHYGYYVHAAAVVGYVDKKLGGTWAEDNKDWVNALIRDVANPSEDDTYFPVSRMFDWFQGHSWAAGLFASGDGKNEESSSEDYNFAYGMKLWGSVIGDGSMEARGNLMLSVMSRAMNMYFYYKSDNTVEPSAILPNKVSGIFFENKVAYTTYFGSPDEHPEYVHGIHMLPITPASSLIRIPSYVEEEWTDQISTFINNVNSGWTGILRLNQALYDPSTSYSFFSSDSWTDSYLDNGQSRTWSLAFSAGVMNAS